MLGQREARSAKDVQEHDICVLRCASSGKSAGKRGVDTHACICADNAMDMSANESQTSPPPTKVCGQPGLETVHNSVNFLSRSKWFCLRSQHCIFHKIVPAIFHGVFHVSFRPIFHDLFSHIFAFSSTVFLHIFRMSNFAFFPSIVFRGVLQKYFLLCAASALHNCPRDRSYLYSKQ